VLKGKCSFFVHVIPHTESRFFALRQFGIQLQSACHCPRRSRDVGYVRHVSDDATLDKVFLQFLAR